MSCLQIKLNFDNFCFSLLSKYSCPSFYPVALPCPTCPCFHSQFPPVVHAHGSFTHIPSLDPSPSFPVMSLSHPSAHSQCVHYFHVSSTTLFICFVHQVPLISEIKWYLSFTAWLFSLSITFCSSIHAVMKGRSSFFCLLHSIPLCNSSGVFLSTHLLTGTQAVSSCCAL